MQTKNKVFSIIILLIILGLCINTISATDDTSGTVSDNTTMSIDSNSSIQNSNVTNQVTYNSSSNSKQLLAATANESNVNKEDSSDAGSFTDLNTLISNGGNYITLNKDYIYNPTTDTHYKNGITISKSITINGNGYTINGLNQAEAFNIKSNNVTFINCTFINTNSTNYGGAIYSNKSNNTKIINCNFINSTGKSGGGVFLFGGNDCYIDNCTFINTSSDSGGAIYWYSANGNISNCRFINVTGFDGGAIFWNNGKDTKILNCTFENTHANDYGGAIFLFGVSSMSYFEMNNSNFINTSSDVQGGAIFWYGPNGTIRNCNFINDSSVENGGAITCVICENGTIDNCSIVNCSSAAGSAIYQGNNYLIIKNSIILDNRANSTDLTINSSNSNIIITLYGLDNLYNGIYINGTVNATNLTYWGLNGVTNTGDESKLFNSNNFTEAGIGLKIKVIDYENNTLIDDVYYTNENGQVILDLNNLSSSKFYLVNASLDNETYYTSISNNGTFDLRKNVSKTEINDIIYGDQVITVVFDDDVTGNATVYINNTRYTGTVINGVSKINIGTKNAGKYVTNVKYSGDNNYLGFNNKEVNFTINKTNPVLNLNVNNTTYGNNITININLTGINGEGLNDTVNLTINGTKYIVNVVDGVGSQILILPNIGVYDIVASFDSTDNYNAVSNTSSFTVSKANLTSFDITVMNTTYNSDNTISFNVIGVNDEAVDGKIIVTINGKDYTVDVTAGKGILILKDLIPNTYDVAAVFQETTNYNNSTKNTQFTVNKATPTITITTENITYGNDETLTIKLTGIGNTGLNGTVILNINGTDYTVNIVNGIGSQDIAEPNAGIYDITANYEGNENYTSTTTTTDYTVAKANLTSFDITVMNTTYNSDNTISFNVAGINNEAIDGKIIVTINGKDYTVDITAGKGILVLKDLIPNTYDVLAVFQETTNYNNSTKNTQFTVNKATPTITITTENITYGNDETLTIKLTGIDNTGLNGTVTLNINGTNYTITITDGTGTQTITKPNAGNYNITANYQGNENYTTTTNTGTYTVGKANITSFDITVMNTTYNSDNTISFNVAGINNEAINGVVIVTVNGNNYIVNIASGKGTLVLKDLIPNTYDVAAVFQETRNYNSSTTNTEFIVSKSAPVIIIIGENITYGNDETVTIILTGVNNTGLNGTVAISLDSFEALNGRLLGSDIINVEIINGKGVYVFKQLNAGIYNISAAYDANENYSSVNNMTSFTVNKADVSVLNVTVNDSVYGGINTVDITAIGINNELLNGTVKVNVNGNEYNLTLNNGKATLDLENLTTGDYTVKVTFGNDNYNNITNETSFTINKSSTNLNISLVNTTFNGKNHTARFNITLDSSNGMLLNETVNVTINNKTYAVNVVNGTGVLDVDGLSAGNYTVESIFNGNDNFDSSNNTVNFTIDYLTPELNVKIVTDGNKAIIYVTLTYNGTGLNGTVTVNFNNKNYTVNVIDGKGNLTLSNLKNGKYGINVIFDGDNIYSGISTNASFSIDVPDKNGTDNGNSNTETSEDNNLKSLRFNGNTLPKTGNPIMVLLLALMALTVVIKRKE
ncbi:Ig-like domain-containing protein [Methanobrevibacter sp. AbM4]|uniref:beta strand repeat-containing protein n=1 Tax=Methanobrevibacter sp. AbM4 TaxID=224719 RepID=UPI0003348833|nr:Ig-like domain-containing protein [Methanobrevibacter sp. AbM4]AGN16734.1 adhesin-like protein [Methanobrevibacter sp. AbM4]